MWYYICVIFIIIYILGWIYYCERQSCRKARWQVQKPRNYFFYSILSSRVPIFLYVCQTCLAFIPFYSFFLINLTSSIVVVLVSLYIPSFTLFTISFPLSFFFCLLLLSVSFPRPRPPPTLLFLYLLPLSISFPSLPPLPPPLH